MTGKGTGPVKVTFSEGELELAQIFGKDPKMMELIHRCDCGELILVCDNCIWLDAKSIDPGVHDLTAMGVMKLGTMNVAVGGDTGGGSLHHLHDHQPPEPRQSDD